MVLSKKTLDKWVSVETQEQEIIKLKNAPVGAVLYEGYIKKSTDIVDTLIHMSGISYRVGVAGYKVTYFKA